MAEREFAIVWHGITFDVEVEYHEDDPKNWFAHKVTATGNLLPLIEQLSNHDYAEFDAEVHTEMSEFAGTRGGE